MGTLNMVFTVDIFLFRLLKQRIYKQTHMDSSHGRQVLRVNNSQVMVRIGSSLMSLGSVEFGQYNFILK